MCRILLLVYIFGNLNTFKKCLAISPSLHPNVTFITPLSYAILYYVEEGQESIRPYCLVFFLCPLTSGSMMIN